MILFLLLQKWEGRKLKALFYLGLTILCNVRFLGEKNIYMTASTLLLASDTVPESLNSLSSLIHIQMCGVCTVIPFLHVKKLKGNHLNFQIRQRIYDIFFA